VRIKYFRDYWKENKLYNVLGIKSSMSRDRFIQIKRYLQIISYNSEDAFDHKLAKVTIVCEMFVNLFQFY
jgi:hypothetical protein